MMGLRRTDKLTLRDLIVPRYDYYCDENDKTVEVVHRMAVRLTSWGELCEKANIEVGSTDPQAAIRKVITVAPMANTPTGDVGLKDMGFTKLVKRDDGVYENVTRSGSEKRFMKSNDPSSMPHFHKKMSD